MLFSEVVAQTSLASRLREGVRSEKVAHAQLFDGSENSGALALARAYAQYLHCTDRIPEDSCGKCASCVAHSKLQHPDLHWSFPFFKRTVLEGRFQIHSKVIGEKACWIQHTLA